MDRIEALRRVPYLKALAEETLREVAGSGHERRLRRGESLFEERSPCLGMIVVLTGGVKVVKIDSRGREIILGIARPGTSLGDLALFDGGNYPASAEAFEEETRVYIMARTRFLSLLATNPQMAVAAVRTLAVENRRLIEMLKAQTLHTVRTRLAAYLLTAAGESDTFSLPETNAVIGSHVGTVREVVSRTLHGLDDLGMIHLRGRTVTLKDREALRRLVDSEGGGGTNVSDVTEDP